MMLTVFGIIILVSLGFSSLGEIYSQNLAAVTYDYVGLNKYDLVHDSDLIVLGKVLDRNSAGMAQQIQGGVYGNLTEIPGIRNTITVEEVIKGHYEKGTIDVITEDDLSGNIAVEGKENGIAIILDSKYYMKICQVILCNFRM